MPGPERGLRLVLVVMALIAVVALINNYVMPALPEFSMPGFPFFSNPGTSEEDHSSDLEPPSDYSELGNWLVDAATDEYTADEIGFVLSDHGWLAGDSGAWGDVHDFSGDGNLDWLLFTSTNSDGGSAVIVVDPDAKEVLHDSQDGLTESIVVSPINVGTDITGDGIADLLYQAEEEDFYQWRLYSLEGDTQDFDSVAYLRLLAANSAFSNGGYSIAKAIYESIALTENYEGSGWEHDGTEEVNAVRRFAGARLILTSYLVDGSDGGYYDEYKALFGEESDLIGPLGAFMAEYNDSGDFSQACAAFRESISDDDVLYPLNDMGDLSLTPHDLCPL